MRRSVLSLLAVAVSGLVFFGTGERVFACEPGAEADSYVRYTDQFGVAPLPLDDSALAALTAELEGRVALSSGEDVNSIRIEQTGSDESTSLMVALALAAPVFTAASVGIFALRNRRH